MILETGTKLAPGSQKTGKEYSNIKIIMDHAKAPFIKGLLVDGIQKISTKLGVHSDAMPKIELSKEFSLIRPLV